MKTLKLKTIIISILLGAMLIGSILIINNDSFYKQAFKPFPYSQTKSTYFYSFLFSLFGYRTVVADFHWIDIVQYMGDLENAKTKYKDLYQKINDLISFDPNFTYVYLAGSGMLYFEVDEKEKALELIKTGIKNNPKYWLLNTYLAAYTYRSKGNFKAAVTQLEGIVKLEGAPPMMERILGSMYLKLSEEEPKNNKFWIRKAIDLWVSIYSHPKDDASKAYAEKHLRDFKLLQ